MRNVLTLRALALTVFMTGCTTGAIEGANEGADEKNPTAPASANGDEAFAPASSAVPSAPTTTPTTTPPAKPSDAPSEAPPSEGSTNTEGSDKPTEEPTKSAGAIVAYWASWTRDVMPVSSIPWKKITHLAHAFVLPAATGGLRNVSAYVDAPLVAAAHANGVKVLASVGGWGANFDMNVDPGVRAKTVAAMADLCKTHGYDGIDLDWEFPTSATAASWSSMVSELRTALNAINPALTVSAAISAAQSNIAVLPASALKQLSFIGVMTYDYAGPWSSSVGHGAPLNPAKGGDGGSVSTSIAYLVDNKGVAAQNVFVGLPFYGYEFAGNALGATPVAPSAGIDYRNLVGRAGTAGWTKQFDSGAQVPYLTRSASPGFTTYDDADSIGAKCNYAKSRALGGAIVWHLAGDRMPDGSQPLLDAAQSCR